MPVALAWAWEQQGQAMVVPYHPQAMADPLAVPVGLTAQDTVAAAVGMAEGMRHNRTPVVWQGTAGHAGSLMALVPVVMERSSSNTLIRTRRLHNAYVFQS